MADIRRVRKCLASALTVYLRAERIIRKVKPDLLITFNGRFATSRPIIEAAKHLNIPVFRHERGCDFKKYEIFSDAIHNFDYIEQRIINSWKQAELGIRETIGHQFYLRRRNGDGIGWYTFTDRQIKGYVPKRLPNKRRIVYFSSSDDEFASVADAYKPGPWPNQMAAIQDLILAYRNFHDLELIIRVHPHLLKKSAISRKIWSNFDCLDIKVIGPDEKIDSYALIDSADIVVSYGSTIGMEAAYWGKPSIVLGPCAYRNFNAVLTPSNSIEIKSLISFSAQLQMPNRANCLPYGHYFLTYGRKFCYYKPESLSEGRFLGRRLGWDPWFIYMMRRIGLGKIYRNFLKLIRCP
jgi:hypothetical protein